jgi:zinc protease
VRTREPEQLGERRVRVERPGTTAYLKMAWQAPAASNPDFVPMLVLDAALSGAKGVNLWASFRNPPQRSTRLYRALVEKGLASSIFGALLPTEEPFLYSVTCTVSDGTPIAALEEAAEAALAVVRADGITPVEFERARHQLRARLVFESDSVTNIAHQIGYFQTLGDVDLYHGLERRLAGVTIDDVARVARAYLAPARRTVGWFQPVETPAGGDR